MGVHLALVWIGCVFHAVDHFGFVKLSFLHQFLHAFRIGEFFTPQPLNVARLSGCVVARASVMSPRCGPKRVTA